MTTTELATGMTIRQLKKCNARIFTYPNGAQLLISYCTPVAAIDCEGYMYVSDSWDYSVTTIKHVRLFLGMYAGEVRDNLRLGSIIQTNDFTGLMNRKF